MHGEVQFVRLFINSLLVAGQPGVREYKLQFYDDGAPTGDFTPVQSATVTP